MNHFFTNSLGDELELPCRYIVKFDKFSFDQKINQFYNRDGGFLSGDGSAKTRGFSVNFTESSVTEAVLISAVRQLFSFLLSKSGPYYLEDRDNNIRWHIALNGFDSGDKKNLTYKYHNGSIKLSVLNPFPESLIAESVNSVMDNLGTLNVPYTGDTTGYPIIRLVSINPITEFTIRLLERDVDLIISDSSFTTGEQYTIDSIFGTVKLGVFDRSYSILSGGLPFLEAGNNTLKYESLDGPCDITVEWRNRFAF